MKNIGQGDNYGLRPHHLFRPVIFSPEFPVKRRKLKPKPPPSLSSDDHVPPSNETSASPGRLLQRRPPSDLSNHPKRRKRGQRSRVRPTPILLSFLCQETRRLNRDLASFFSFAFHCILRRRLAESFQTLPNREEWVDYYDVISEPVCLDDVAVSPRPVLLKLQLLEI